ncbi:MAG: 1-phosphofructokinase family hexose kinase [Burkholderiales bacterium]|nr:1-phosphofructokinase family hexose kinase [Burkholderiales bacterium]
MASLNTPPPTAGAPPVVTITMNPALDVSTAVDQVIPTHKLRCEAAFTHPGGGGINVARVIHRLGTPCLALFPSGGATGQSINTLLGAEGVPFHTVTIAQESRESFSVRERQTGQDYRFVLPGPRLNDSEWQACLKAIQTLQPVPRYLIASGSLAPGVPEDFYAQLAQHCHSQGCHLILDSSGAALRQGLMAGVHLFKPSLRELQELTSVDLSTREQRIQASRTLIQKGWTQCVALSLGDEGAMLITDNQAWYAAALPVTIASTIGAGDSFLAGLIWSLNQNHPPQRAFAHGMAAATAALLSSGTALCNPEDVQRLLTQVHVTPC